MKKINILSAVFMACVMLLSTFTFTACQQEELSTDQFTGTVTLLGFGPNPVARGGQLRFIGVGLDQVASVNIPGCEPITEIEVKSAKEIYITVPQTAQPGKVVLKTKGGVELTSAASLTYTEPVGFAEENALAPNPVKPGNVLTIKGEYLNLVTSVLFDKVELAKDAFKSHSREEISLVVPAEAKTGKVTLSFCATGDTIPNLIASKEVLEVVLPSVKLIAELKETKPGDVVSVLGKDFDLVTSVLSPAGDELEFSVNAEFTELTFALPANVTNGVIFMTTASGVQVAAATIGVALPKQLSITPNENVRAGNIITISGKDLELVTTIGFTSMKGEAEGEIQAGRTATEIKVAVPAEAITGTIILHTAAGVSVDAEHEAGLTYETLKPSVKNFGAESYSLGSLVTIYGKNLDLVAKVVFTGGATVEELDATPNVLNVQMPVFNAETGELTLIMGNGEAVLTAPLTIDLPEFCYVSDPTVFITTDEVELKAGTIVVAEVEHLDRLESVEVDGNEVQVIKQGNKLYVLTPENAGMKSVITLYSGSYGSIEYPLSVVPNTEQKRVVWAGMTEITWADGGRVFIPGTAFDGVPVGAELVFCYTQKDQTWAQAQVNDGWWGNGDISTFETPEGTSINNPIVPTDIYGWFEDGQLNRETSIVLTQELLDHLLSHVGDDGSAIIIQGQDLIFTQVYIRWTISMEETIWSGSEVCDGWSAVGFLSDGGTELLAAGLKVGSIVRFYVTPTEANWNAQVTEGHWGPKWTDYNQDNYDLAGNNGAIVLEITQEMYDALTTPQNWGNSFLLNADNLVCTKITIE